MKTLVFVTQNHDKIADARKLLPEFEIEHVDFDVPEIQSMDPREITEYKIKFAYQHIGKPCFVWDTALFLDALNGFPGPFIKWYYSSVGPQKICQMSQLFNQSGCQWTNVLGYFDGQQTHFLEETVRGNVSDEPRGENGYAWDVIFVPEGETRTLAQMSFDEKQSYAVTKRQLEKFKELLKS